MLLDKLIRVLTVFICVVLLLNIVLFINAHRTPVRVSGKATTETPYFFLDSRNYWSEITDILACGDQLYVMYDSKKILTCYDRDGNYLHSYLFSMANNGQTHLYSVKDTLYVETREHNFYSFEEGVFVNFYSQNSSQAYELSNVLSELENDHQTDRHEHYELRNASVWRVSKSEQREVLHRSGWLVIFQGANQFIIYALCLLTLAALYFFIGKRNMRGRLTIKSQPPN